MGRDFLNQLFQISADVRAFDGGGQAIGHAAQLFLFFYQNHLKTLIGNTQRSVHPGDSAADDQRPLNDINLFLGERI